MKAELVPNGRPLSADKPLAYRPASNTALVCAWHLFPAKEELEARARREWPGCQISHCACVECRDRVLGDVAARQRLIGKLRRSLYFVQSRVSKAWRARDWQLVWAYSKDARRLRGLLSAVRKGEA